MQAHVFILQLKQQELRHFVIWTPGWKKWIPVKEMLKSDQKFFVIPPPIDQTDKDATKISKTLTDLTKSLSGNSSSASGRSNSGHKGERTYTEIALTSAPPGDFDEFEPENMNWEKTPVIPVLKKNSDGDSDSDDDRRTYKRFPHRIEIVLMTRKGKSFRSSSLNVSFPGGLGNCSDTSLKSLTFLIFFATIFTPLLLFQILSRFAITSCEILCS